MANNCSNRLIVAELKEHPERFAKSLERALYGGVLPKENYYAVSVVESRHYAEFRFKSDWGAPVNRLTPLSAKREETLLLEYSCWESDFRGQSVIKNGEVVEHICREGYSGPAYLFADMTDPLVDLFWPHLGTRTLAQHATRRLQDAISIVMGLTETLNDERFTNSRFRAYRNREQVSRVLASLTVMQQAMVEHAAGISFDGVLLENSALEGSEEELVRARRGQRGG